MKKKLKLSPEQTEKVADISTKYAIAQSDLMQKIMGKGRPSEKAVQQVTGLKPCTEAVDLHYVQVVEERSVSLRR